MEPVALHDDTVLLSPPTEADVDAITAACQDPEVAAWVTVPQPYRRQDGEGFVRSFVPEGWASGRDLVWAIREPDGRLLGMVGLHGIEDGSAELGYWVAPWGRRRGAAGSAVRLVVDHAFGPLGLVRLSWTAYEGNWPSRRIAWRSGFRVEGMLRLGTVQRGVRRDTWVGSLLAADPRGPAEPWPADAPPDGHAVVGAPGVPVGAGSVP